jgi:hypothetical protein
MFCNPSHSERYNSLLGKLVETVIPRSKGRGFFKSMNLELAAMRWLWLEKNCHYVLEQRSPRYHLGSPDVLGVTKDRYLIEIEIKRSISDFRADNKKRCRSNRDLFIDHMAKQFYYLVPPNLVEKVKPILPLWAGLMTINEAGYVYAEISAMVNKDSKRLSIKECVKLARCMTNHMMCYAVKCRDHHNQFMQRDDLLFVQWNDPNSGTYQI